MFIKRTNSKFWRLGIALGFASFISAFLWFDGKALLGLLDRAATECLGRWHDSYLSKYDAW